MSKLYARYTTIGLLRYLNLMTWYILITCKTSFIRLNWIRADSVPRRNSTRRLPNGTWCIDQHRSACRKNFPTNSREKLPRWFPNWFSVTVVGQWYFRKTFLLVLRGKLLTNQSLGDLTHLREYSIGLAISIEAPPERHIWSSFPWESRLLSVRFVRGRMVNFRWWYGHGFNVIGIGYGSSNNRTWLMKGFVVWLRDSSVWPTNQPEDGRRCTQVKNVISFDHQLSGQQPPNVH